MARSLVMVMERGQVGGWTRKLTSSGYDRGRVWA